MNSTFKSHGKLLITGEYFVLNGAKALSIPTSYYQTLKVDKIESKIISWKSYDNKKNIWIYGDFKLPNLEIINDSTDELLYLQKLLLEIKKLNPQIFKLKNGYKLESNMNFDRSWGLGSSSTLICNLSKWSQTDPYQLLWAVSKGSGYDIASSIHESPIVYQINNKNPIINKVQFKPKFHENLFFVHLNKKQKTDDEINLFQKIIIDDDVINQITQITDDIVKCDEMDEFKNLIIKHENLTSNTLNKKTIKEKLFNDFSGEIKSLGAWGGDFALVIGDVNSAEYFKNKGYETIISFNSMLNNS